MNDLIKEAARTFWKAKGNEYIRRINTKFKEKFYAQRNLYKERLANYLTILLFIYQPTPLPVMPLHNFTDLNPNTLTNFEAEYGVGFLQKTPPVGVYRRILTKGIFCQIFYTSSLLSS
jgi:hypothetical protein